MLKRLINYVRSDIKVKGTKYFDYDKKVIDGFYFMYKKPFTKRYSRHAPISIEYLDYVLNKLDEALNGGKNEVDITLNEGTIDEEKILIPYRKVLKICLEMSKLKIKVLENKQEYQKTKEVEKKRVVKNNVIY